MNLVTLMGRLTADPDVRYTQGNPPTAIANYTLAVDRRRQSDNEQTADFIRCVSFGKVAELAEKHLHKGTKIALTGRWQTGSFTNKDGQKVYTNDCVVDNVYFCESKKETQPEQQYTPSSVGDGFMNVPAGIDEQLPFAK